MKSLVRQKIRSGPLNSLAHPFPGICLCHIACKIKYDPVYVTDSFIYSLQVLGIPVAQFQRQGLHSAGGSALPLGAGLAFNLLIPNRQTSKTNAATGFRLPFRCLSGFSFTLQSRPPEGKAGEKPNGPVNEMRIVRSIRVNNRLCEG